MKIHFQPMILMAAIALLPIAGCGGEESVGVPHTHDDLAEVTLCGKCGEVKGSENCCQDGIDTCTHCGLHKDSILCCSPAIHGVRDVILCRKCGEVAFTEACCQEASATCKKCGLVEDSPGCCKIEPLDESYDPNHSSTTTHAHSDAHGGDHR